MNGRSFALVSVVSAIVLASSVLLSPVNSVVESSVPGGRFAVSMAPALWGSTGGRNVGDVIPDTQLINPNKPSITSTLFHVPDSNGNYAIYQEDSFGTPVQIATWSVPKLGVLDIIAQNSAKQFFAFSGGTAYYFINAAAITAGTPVSSKTGMTASLLGFAGPLGISSGTENGFVWGEYKLDGTVPSIWRAMYSGKVVTWTKVLSDTGARHFHQMDYDVYNPGVIYASTGDTNPEVNMYKSSDYGKTWSRVAGGSQIYRTLRMFFTPTEVYWLTDTPNSPSLVMAARSDMSAVTVITQITGTTTQVIYGGTLVWQPYGIFFGIIDGSPTPKTSPVYFYSFTDAKLYHVYDLVSRQTGYEIGLRTTLPYQDLATGKIWGRIIYCQPELAQFFGIDVMHTVSFTLSQSLFN